MNHLRNAQWMQERGHEVVVIGIENSPFIERAHTMNLIVESIPSFGKYYDLKAGKKLSALLTKLKVTHLITRATRDLSITANVKSRLKGQIHTSYFMEMQLGVKKTGLSHTQRFKGIDLWSCPLLWLKEQVETMTHFRNELVHIPSGLVRPECNSIPSQQDARRELDLPENDFIFGLIGRFDPQKGQLLVLEALKKAESKDIHLLLIGEPTIGEGEEYHQNMLQLIREEGLENRVHVRPFQNNLAASYSAIDWMIMATKAESIGMVTLECLAHGTPVLGSNAGGTPEILQLDKGGQLFETMNSDNLANKLDQIVKENVRFKPEALRSLTDAFDHQKVCEEVEKVLGLIPNL